MVSAFCFSAKPFLVVGALSAGYISNVRVSLVSFVTVNTSLFFSPGESA
jgi:hypothetical protein